MNKLQLLNAVTDLYNEVVGPCLTGHDWTEALRWAFVNRLITAGEHSAVLAGTPLP